MWLFLEEWNSLNSYSIRKLIPWPLFPGTWNGIDSLNLTRIVEFTEESNPINIMANKTFVVTLIQNPPYTMLKEETKKLEGNDRFEGFAIDLFTEIAKILHFNITFKLVDDGKVMSEFINIDLFRP
jgi:hypothetical protein